MQKHKLKTTYRKKHKKQPKKYRTYTTTVGNNHVTPAYHFAANKFSKQQHL